MSITMLGRSRRGGRERRHADSDHRVPLGLVPGSSSQAGQAGTRGSWTPVAGVDARSGVAEEVGLHGESLTNGDGLLLEGRTLYAVQNRLNVVAVARLNGHATEGRVVGRLTGPRFDVPTTIARFEAKLYLPNARFSTPPTPDTHFDAVGIHRQLIKMAREVCGRAESPNVAGRR